MKKQAGLLEGALIVATLCWSGCRSSPQPERSFSEAEQLRARYEEDASQQAIGKYREAIAGWERQGNKRRAAQAWQRVGAVHEQLGSLNESLDAYRAALALVDGSSDRLLESEILSDVGIAQSYTASHKKVLENEARGQCDRALTLARQSGGERQTGRALDCLGEVAYFLLDYARALDFYRQAGQVFSAVGDELGQARTELHQGHVYSDLGRLDEAEACLNRAHALWTRVGDRRQQAITKVAKGRLEVRRGNYQEALNQFQDALTSLEPMGDAVWKGSSLYGIGWVYQEMADTRSVLKYWEHALQLYEAAGLKIFAVEQLYHLGATHLELGDQALAMTYFERVLAIADELDIERWRAWALRYIGVVHLVRREPRQALQYLDQAAEAQRRLEDQDPRLERELRLDLGVAHDLMEEHDVAARYFEEALPLSRAVTDRVTEARALFGLARASLGARKLDKARAQIERALSVVESLRTEVENRDLRASYVASVYGYHELHVDVLARLHKVRPRAGLSARAFEASERARARSLLESLTESGVDLRAGVDPDLLRREQLAKLAFSNWADRNRRVAADPARKAEAQRLAGEYRELEQKYGQIQAEIRSRSPRYAALAKPEPLSLREIQKGILDRDTVLIEYALGEERSYMWVVSHNAHTLYELPGRAGIEDAARRVYERLVARLSDEGSQERHAAIARADEEYWQEAARLSEILIGPIAEALRGKRLLVVTDGMLQYLPFAALPIPRRSGAPVPMLVEHEIVNLPSASVLAVLRKETAGRAPPPKAVAVLADPVFESDDPRLRGRGSPGQPGTRAATAARGSAAARTPLPIGFTRDGAWAFRRLASTRQEADAIVAMVPEGMGLRKIGFDASRSTATSPELSQYRIVHFATHGVFDNENPGLSGLILSLYDEGGLAQDGFLRLHDIYSLRLPADLIVLSACSTALGKQVKGEGLMGMVRGFLYAGTERVVASLWKVDDEATGELMRRFYAGMLQEKRSPAAALRQAQLAMWQEERFQAPFYWAAFVLQGEWR